MKHNIIASLTPRGQIRLRITFDGKRLDVATGLSYDADKWANGKAKPNTKNQNRQTATEINGSVARMVEQIDNYFSLCEIERRKPTADGIRCALSNRSSELDGVLFPKAFDAFMLDYQTKQELTIGSQRIYWWTRNKIAEYFPNLMVRQLDTDMVLHIKDTISRNLKNHTIKQLHSRIDVFVKWAVEKYGLRIDLEKTRQRIKLVSAEARVYLTDDEIEKLRNVELKPSYDYVRDAFLFSCYCGLRLSDIRKLRKSDIYDDAIHIVTQKTSKQIHIELNRHTRSIRKKYLDLYPDMEKLFPIPISDRVRLQLRRIAKKAGIDSTVTITYYKGERREESVLPKRDVLSFHAARRTFVVQCLQRGIPPLVVMKWTGHANLKSMAPYIAILDETKKSEMQKFDK